MLGKYMLEIFSYTSRKSNFFMNLALKPSLQYPHRILPFVRSVATKFSMPNVAKDPSEEENSKNYFWRYILSRDDYNAYCKNIDRVTESYFKSIEILSDLEKRNVFSEKDIQLTNEALKCLETEISSFGVEDLSKALVLTSKCRIINHENKNLYRLQNCIDNELLKRKFSNDEILKILVSLKVDGIGLQLKSSYFPFKASMKLLSKLNTLSPQEVVLLFFSLPKKNIMKQDFRFFVYTYLNYNISNFNSDEIGIIASGLGRVDFSLGHKDTYDCLLNATFNKIEEFHPIAFRSVCKALQKFIKYQNVSSCLDFQEKIIPYLSKLDEISLMEVALLGQNRRALNLNLKNYIVEKFRNNSQNLSLLVISRIIVLNYEILIFKAEDKIIPTDGDCIIYPNFWNNSSSSNVFKKTFFFRIMNLTVKCNIQNKDLLEALLENIKLTKLTEEDKQSYKKLIFILKCFSDHKVYPEDLLNEIVSLKTLKIIFDFPITCKVWWFLYCQVSLEKPEYIPKEINFDYLRSIPRMTKFLESFERIGLYSKPKFSYISAINNALLEIFGEKKTFITNVLPQYKSGIVLKFNKEFQAQDLLGADFFDNNSLAKKPLDDDNFWIFVMLLFKIDFVQENNALVFLKQTELRLLKIIGYIPLMVRIAEFMEKEEEDKKQFLSNLIQEALKNHSKKINS